MDASCLPESPTRPYAIDIVDLTYAWPQHDPILKNLCLQVPRGELWMLLGANGSGKSTLLQLMSGLLEIPEGSSIQLDRPLGYVFQNPDRQLVMPTVGADVAFGLAGEALSQIAIRQRVGAALDSVGLLHLMRRPIYALSGGQKHRVAIAGALARRSRLLLLDEPTALLDPDSQRDLIRQVRQLVDTQGLSALWITHRLEELDWADGAILLANGAIAERGRPTVLKDHLSQLLSA
ncbi:energy-coupling factor ABC transporter ATP-binding protein [Synechococcus sp. PCC 7336]|uniref:energy-coupling factor ABC transporter ATP-binding protein n=1 Tax=Synechococcus sp. PCC 7336 TaxID=195250 RepID=UPI00034DF4B2|nr:ABC transporter ATP-binding protein [Synechococcus sp. PCC 7336]